MIPIISVLHVSNATVFSHQLV